MSTSTMVSIDAHDDEPEIMQHRADVLAALFVRQTGCDRDWLDEVNYRKTYSYVQVWETRRRIEGIESVGKIASRLFPGLEVEVEETWDDDGNGGNRTVFLDGRVIRTAEVGWIVKGWKGWVTHE